LPRGRIEPVIAAEVGRMLTNIILVAAGVGVSLVPASMQEIRLGGGICYLRLAHPGRLRAPLALATRCNDERPTVANLLRLTAEIAHRHHAAAQN
jgi:DNA-binding transcriptional LysR family regulator